MDTGEQTNFIDDHNSFDEYKLREDVVEDYRQQDGELDRVLLEIQNREATGRLPRFRIGGPTGAGKTLFARAVAAELDVPFITIQCKYSMNEADLLGSPELVDGETVWQTGPLTRAVLASQQGPVVLLLDEVNRARPESKGVLFSALDDRCMVQLEARDTVPIRGNPQNLIVFSTINEGREYFTEELDLAERRRLGNKISLNYLGQERPQEEIDLLVERTPVSEDLAPYLVNAANDIRDVADDRDSHITKGVPTSMLLDWGATAAAYSQGEIENPVMEAAKEAVINPFYGAHDEDRARTEVEQIIRNYVDDAPIGDTKDGWVSGNGDSVQVTQETEIPDTVSTDQLRNAGLPEHIINTLDSDGDGQVSSKLLQKELDLSDKMVIKVNNGDAEVLGRFNDNPE